MSDKPMGVAEADAPYAHMGKTDAEKAKLPENDTHDPLVSHPMQPQFPAPVGMPEGYTDDKPGYFGSLAESNVGTPGAHPTPGPDGAVGDGVGIDEGYDDDIPADEVEVEDNGSAQGAAPVESNPNGQGVPATGYDQAGAPANSVENPPAPGAPAGQPVTQS